MGKTRDAIDESWKPQRDAGLTIFPASRQDIYILADELDAHAERVAALEGCWSECIHGTVEETEEQTLEDPREKGCFTAAPESREPCLSDEAAVVHGQQRRCHR